MAVYFAYSTLLKLEGMRKYCPSAKSLGTMKLKDYKMGFSWCGADPSVGGATLVKDPGNVMYGVLFDMPDSELAAMDKAAGIDKGMWSHMDITLIDENDNEIPAMTYTINNSAGAQQPTDDYVKPIVEGAKEFNLPASYIEQLASIVQNAQA